MKFGNVSRDFFTHPAQPSQDAPEWGGRGRGVSRVVSEGIVIHITRLSKGWDFPYPKERLCTTCLWEFSWHPLVSRLRKVTRYLSPLYRQTAKPARTQGKVATPFPHKRPVLPGKRPTWKAPCGRVAASRGFLGVMSRRHVHRTMWPDNKHCCSTTGWQKGRDTGYSFPILAEQMGFIIDQRACRWLEQEKPPAPFTDKLRNPWCQPVM